MDGRQRITTILDFLNNRFKLKDLRILHTLNNSIFDDLEPKLQGIFEDYQLFFYIIQPPTPERVKYDIFDRVNRGGTSLNNQEMRNALYRGISTELIDRICESDVFKAATNRGVSPRRMRDRYVILRTIAFYYLFTNKLRTADFGKPIEYKSDIDDFLAKVMIYFNRNMDRQEQQETEELFLRAFDKIYCLLGEKAFRFEGKAGKRRPINMPLLECLTYLFLFEWSVDNVSLFREKIDKVKLQFDHSGWFKGNVDSSINLAYRYAEIQNLLNDLQ